MTFKLCIWLVGLKKRTFRWGIWLVGLKKIVTYLVCWTKEEDF